MCDVKIRTVGLTGVGCEEWVAERVISDGYGAEVGRRSLVSD
ncbi:hypothetical protein TM233_67380 [Bradyrhizobium sp. TM233]|nr:hypothetical protein TM233_67380 [Bradyrhizobium sp. TM233]